MSPLLEGFIERIYEMPCLDQGEVICIRDVTTYLNRNGDTKATASQISGVMREMCDRGMMKRIQSGGWTKLSLLTKIGRMAWRRRTNEQIGIPEWHPGATV